LHAEWVMLAASPTSPVRVQASGGVEDGCRLLQGTRRG
jgi:hypothetical protein